MSDLDIPVFIPTMDITEKKTVYYTSRNIKMKNVIWIDQ